MNAEEALEVLQRMDESCCRHAWRVDGTDEVPERWVVCVREHGHPAPHRDSFAEAAAASRWYDDVFQIVGPSFSRENDSQEEHMSGFAEAAGIAGVSPSMPLQAPDRPQSELEAAVGLVDQAVSELENLVPSLWERYAAVMVPSQDAVAKPVDPRQPFQAPAADRLSVIGERLQGVHSTLIAFRNADQA